jgi:nuclear pore complex protein Nup205
MTRGISPAEIYGLVSVLRLIESVCSQSEMARIAIAENPAWQPILVLIGLLSCSVPAVLKSEILKTLAALAKTPDIGQVSMSIKRFFFVTAAPEMKTSVRHRRAQVPQGVIGQAEQAYTSPYHERHW